MIIRPVQIGDNRFQVLIDGKNGPRRESLPIQTHRGACA